MEDKTTAFPSREPDVDFLDQLQAAIRNTPERAVEVLAPISGKLFHYYLKQRWKKIFNRRKQEDPALFSPAKHHSKPGSNEVQQVWLIERGSGRIKTALYPNAGFQAIDHQNFLSDLVAATAYQDGTLKEEEEVLLCDPYEAYLRRFVTHAVAVVFHGPISPKLRRRVSRRVQEFYQACMAIHLDLVFASPFGKLPSRQVDEDRLRQQLYRSFGKFQR